MARPSYIGVRIAVTALLAALTGCGELQPTFGAPRAVLPTPAIGAHIQPDGSWMLPEAKNDDLLYVANYEAAVNVYDYKTLKLVGTLSVDAPGGECTDKVGNVFITAVRNASILEYAHGGTSPIASLSDPTFYPGDCFVDPASGDLCVANLDGVPNPGNLAIYRHARGTPKFYYDSNSDIAYYYSCTYDADGNAFVDDSFVSGQLKFDELAVGARTLRRIWPGRHRHGGGALDWDGKFLTDGDGGNRIYRFSVGVDQKRVYHDGLTLLKNAVGGISKTWIWRYGGQRELIGTAQNNNAVEIFSYPDGRLLRSISSGLDEPDGVAVSQAP